MQDWSKRNPNRNKSYTKHYGSITYSNKPLQALPLRPLRVQQISPSWSKHKILIPCPLPIKKLGKREEIPKKMRNPMESKTASTSQNMPCGSHLNWKNKDLPTFSASQESMFSARRKTSKTKRNYMIHNYLIGKNPVCSGWASKVLNSSKKYGFSHAQRRYLPSFRCFCACNPLSWADIVANLSSIHDKNHQISSISLPSPLGGTSVRDDLSVLEISVQYYHLRVLGW